MTSVHTAIAAASRNVRRMRSARWPNGIEPRTPIKVIEVGSAPIEKSLTWKCAWIPSAACDSDPRSPVSSMTVAARATTG